MIRCVGRLLLVVPLALAGTTAGAQTVAVASEGMHRAVTFGQGGIIPADGRQGAADVSGTSPRSGRPLAGIDLAPSVTQSGSQPVRRDSLWNGALVGMGLGALAGSLGSLAIIDCSECAGFNVPLTFGVVGAGIGAGIGAGLDAAFSRSFSHRQPRVRVSPLLVERGRGLMAWIRF